MSIGALRVDMADAEKVEQYLQKVYIYLQYLHQTNNKQPRINSYSSLITFRMKKNKTPPMNFQPFHHVVPPTPSKSILNFGSYFSSHPIIIEDANEEELSSVDTIPKGSKNDQVQTDHREPNPHQEKSTEKSQDIKIYYQPSEKQLWKASMKFDYFFQTLNDHPDDRRPALLPFKETYATFNEYLQQQDQLPLLSRKKRKDKEWGSFHIRNKLSYDAPQRRKSSRLEQIQQKQRLQSQMKDMRCSYFRGKYRYEIPSVRFRLSFLEANCLQHQEYWSQTIEDIPSHPILSLLPQVQKKKVIYKKALNLHQRVMNSKVVNSK